MALKSYWQILKQQTRIQQFDISCYNLCQVYDGLDFRRNLEVINQTFYSTEQYTKEAVTIIKNHNQSQVTIVIEFTSVWKKKLACFPQASKYIKSEPPLVNIYKPSTCSFMLNLYIGIVAHTITINKCRDFF